MPSAAAAAQQLSPAQLGELQALTSLAVSMVRAVARTGSGFYLQEVHEFQSAWNGARESVVAALAALGARGSWFELVEDGQYGPQTSTALWMVLDGAGVPQPPRRASGMPVYYASNRSILDGIVPPSTSVAPQVLSTPVPAPPQEGAASVPAEVYDAIDNSSGQAVSEYVSVTASGEGPAPMPGSGPLEPLETELVTEHSMAETTIVGTPRRGGVPIIAIGAGMLALGASFWWWIHKKKAG